MTTIRDLAKRAGVSVATVSRALNSYPDVNEETRQKVLTLARELNFKPSAMARGLVTRRSNLVGVFFRDHINSDLLHPFFQEVIVGFKKTVGQAGFDLLFFTNQEEGHQDFSYARRCRHRQVDGAVVMGVNPHDPEVFELAASGIPCMAVDMDLIGKRAGYVMSDSVQGAVTAVRHLYGLGHRRIGFISGIASTRPGHDRIIGYRKALEELRLPYRSEYVEDGDFTQVGGYAAMQRLLRLEQPPTAIFAAGDMMAIGAIAACRDRHLRVPEEMAVVGFDDIQIAGIVHPALTTIRQDKERLGAAAGESLIRMIDDPAYTPPPVVLSTELVIRESCGGSAVNR